MQMSPINEALSEAVQLERIVKVLVRLHSAIWPEPLLFAFHMSRLKIPESIDLNKPRHTKLIGIS